jgi:hypothetical protein
MGNGGHGTSTKSKALGPKRLRGSVLAIILRGRNQRKSPRDQLLQHLQSKQKCRTDKG